MTIPRWFMVTVTLGRSTYKDEVSSRLCMIICWSIIHTIRSLRFFEIFVEDHHVNEGLGLREKDGVVEVEKKILSIGIT